MNENEISLDQFLNEGGSSVNQSFPDKQTILSKIRFAENSASNSTSPKGAQGRYQIMPANQKKFGLSDPTNDEQSGEVAWKLFTDAYSRYSKKFPDKSSDEIEKLSFLDFNGGPRAVTNHLSGTPFKESQQYLKRLSKFSDENQPSNEISLDDFLGSSEPFNPVLNPSQLKLNEQYSHNTKTPDSGVDALNVGIDSAIRAGSAGFVQPGWATKQERQDHPVSDVVGSMVGTLPYTLIPGGVPAQSAALATRGLSQTMNEGGTLEQGLVSGALEGASPVISKGLGMGINLLGQAIKKPAEFGAKKVMEYYRGPEVTKLMAESDSTVDLIKKLNQKLGDKTLTSAERKDIAMTRQYYQDKQMDIDSKLENFSLITQAADKSKTMTLKDVVNKLNPFSSPITSVGGAGLAYLTSDEENKIRNAVAAFAGGTSLKLVALQLASQIPKVSPYAAEQLILKVSPASQSKQNLRDLIQNEYRKISKTVTPDNIDYETTKAVQKALDKSKPTGKVGKMGPEYAVGQNYDLLGQNLENATKPLQNALGYSSLLGSKINDRNRNK